MAGVPDPTAAIRQRLRELGVQGGTKLPSYEPVKGRKATPGRVTGVNQRPRQSQPPAASRGRTHTSPENPSRTATAPPKAPRAATLPRRVSKAIPGEFAPAKERAKRGMGWDTAMAMQLAKDGNDLDLLWYQPTPTINPDRPRTLAAGYDPDTRTLRVRFRDGTPWEYYDVPEDTWSGFFHSPSPGRYINNVLNNYEYAQGDW